ncbi:hypothetical protein [Robiginitalea sp. SC105]|uniref:hypothetical protein n=1 Tax=Robiginitalea sp. SC105 TaxID=2762332 RepID=UPI00163AC177|nr:hypothetical protein [Robiginitalea sp. SC105]MBC2838893.1 hypothetical protein [Robiginitalea sp. SC105]
MKTPWLLLFIPTLLIIPTLSPAQDESFSDARNELKINALSALLEVPEVTYERILGADGAIGLSFGLGPNESFGYRFAATPYYRFYFGKPAASGFFLELNSLVGSWPGYFSYTQSDSGFESSQGSSRLVFGLGIAAGAKFFTSRSWIGEIYLGFGRYLSSDPYNDFVGYPRLGIAIGKRI